METPRTFDGVRYLIIREQVLGIGSTDLRKSFRHWWMPDKSKSEGREVRGPEREREQTPTNGDTESVS